VKCPLFDPVLFTGSPLYLTQHTLTSPGFVFFHGHPFHSLLAPPEITLRSKTFGAVPQASWNQNLIPGLIAGHALVVFVSVRQSFFLAKFPNQGDLSPLGLTVPLTPLSLASPPPISLWGCILEVRTWPLHSGRPPNQPQTLHVNSEDFSVFFPTPDNVRRPDVRVALSAPKFRISPL